MNELQLVVAWLASVAGGADCGICNAINNGFDNLLNLGIGVAGAAGAAAGTVAGGASRVGDAARDARDAFNNAYDRASGGGDSPPPDNSDWFSNRLRDAADTANSQAPAPHTPGQFPPAFSNPTNPWARAFSGQAQNPNAPMPGGGLDYFNVGGPTGSQLGGQQ